MSSSFNPGDYLLTDKEAIFISQYLQLFDTIYVSGNLKTDEKMQLLREYPLTPFHRYQLINKAVKTIYDIRKELPSYEAFKKSLDDGSAEAQGFFETQLKKEIQQRAAFIEGIVALSKGIHECHKKHKARELKSFMWHFYFIDDSHSCVINARYYSGHQNKDKDSWKSIMTLGESGNRLDTMKKISVHNFEKLWAYAEHLRSERDKENPRGPRNQFVFIIKTHKKVQHEFRTLYKRFGDSLFFQEAFSYFTKLHELRLAPTLKRIYPGINEVAEDLLTKKGLDKTKLIEKDLSEYHALYAFTTDKGDLFIGQKRTFAEELRKNLSLRA